MKEYLSTVTSNLKKLGTTREDKLVFPLLLLATLELNNKESHQVEELRPSQASKLSKGYLQLIGLNNNYLINQISWRNSNKKSLLPTLKRDLNQKIVSKEQLKQLKQKPLVMPSQVAQDQVSLTFVEVEMKQTQTCLREKTAALMPPTTQHLPVKVQAVSINKNK